MEDKINELLQGKTYLIMNTSKEIAWFADSLHTWSLDDYGFVAYEKALELKDKYNLELHNLSCSYLKVYTIHG